MLLHLPAVRLTSRRKSLLPAVLLAASVISLPKLPLPAVQPTNRKRSLLLADLLAALATNNRITDLRAFYCHE